MLGQLSFINQYTNMQCPICTNKFDAKQYVPMIICMKQHTYCIKCVSQIREKHKKCPECRQTIRRSAHKNRMLIDLLENVSRKREQINQLNIQKCLVYAYQKNCKQVLDAIKQNKPSQSVEQISLAGRGLNKIQCLAIYVNAVTINLSYNCLQKIENLPKSKKLKELYLKKNQIDVIQGLDFLINLEKLSINQNVVRKITGLSNLKKLKHLFLNNNQIKKIQGLEQCQELQILNLAFNKIEKIENVEKNKNLKFLTLQANYIGKIENLSGLPLKVLSLDNNQISQYPKQLENFEKLQTISLIRNKIKNTSNCPGLIQSSLFFFMPKIITRKNPLKIYLGQNQICQELKQISEIDQHFQAGTKSPTIYL